MIQARGVKRDGLGEAAVSRRHGTHADGAGKSHFTMAGVTSLTGRTLTAGAGNTNRDAVAFFNVRNLIAHFTDVANPFVPANCRVVGLP